MNRGGLVILQINLYDCRNANEVLADYVSRQCVDVVLYQDPYDVSDETSGIPPDLLFFFSFTYTSAVLITYKYYVCIGNLVLDSSVFVNFTVGNSVLHIGS